MASYGLLLWGRARQLRPSLVRDPGIPRSDWRAAPRNPIGATPSSLGWLILVELMEDPMKMDDLGLLFQETSIFWKSWGTQKAHL